jgi:hypothetical protein
MSIFKKSPADRRAALAAQLKTAEVALEKARGAAVKAAVDGAADAAQASAEEAIHRSETHVEVLENALAQLDREAAQAEQAEIAAKDRTAREATSRALHKLADSLEKAVTPLPNVLLDLKSSVDNCGSILGPPGGLPTLLENMSKEIPAAIGLFTGELRARAEATLAGNAPATLPAPPVLEIVPPTPPIPQEPMLVEVFVTRTLEYRLQGEKLVRIAYPTQKVFLPPAMANQAIGLDAALPAGDPRIPQERIAISNRQRAAVGHSAEPIRLDPEPTLHHSRFGVGQQLVEQQPFVNYRESEPPRLAMFSRLPEPAPGSPDEF